LSKASVLPIRADLGPPTTDFEREAVDALLGAIRKYRGRAGADPHFAITVLVGEDDGHDYRRATWYSGDGQTLTAKHLAWASLVLAHEALNP
jgi:hypothetical protein